MTIKKRVLPTEAIIFHVFILFVAMSIIFIRRSSPIPMLCTFGYTIFSVIVYWLVTIKFKRTKVLEKWWTEHVIDPRVNRISVAIIIYTLDLSHVFLLFGGLYILIGNVLFYLNNHTSTLQWLQAITYAVQCAGIQTNREYLAPGIMGVMLTIFSSLTGLVFVAVWVAVFMSAFEIVFKKPEKLKGMNSNKTI